MNNKIKSPKGKSNGEKPRDIRDVAARKLSYRARTKAELRKLLSKEEYSENEIDDVIQEFSDLGYLDDVAYSVSYLGYASSKGWADSRGIRELRQKGVSESDIKRSLKLADIFCQSGKASAVQSCNHIAIRHHDLIQRLFESSHIPVEFIESHLIPPISL